MLVDEFRELDLRLQQLDRRTSSTSEQLSRQDGIAFSKKENVRARMAKLQENYESIMLEREGMMADQELKLKDIRAVEEAIVELTKQTEAEMAQADAAYKDLRNDVCESLSMPFLQ